MSYKDFYLQIKNPILSDDVVKKLIEAYSVNKPFNNFYSNIIESQHYPIEPFNRTHKDLFFEFIFNKWRNAILSIPSERTTNPDIPELQRILRSAPPIKSETDFIKFEGSSKRIEELVETYSWPHDISWQHIKSKRIESVSQKGFNVSHRLYLNVPSGDLHKTAILLIKKLEEKGLEYYFKILSHNSDFISEYSRSDSLVMYSDTEKLLKYVEILRELKMEHPEIGFREPPILTGKIDGWIGYGSEPGLTPSGKLTSFSLLRSEIVEKAIGLETRKFVNQKRDNQAPGKGKTVKELFLKLCTDYFIEEQKKSIESIIKHGNKMNPTDDGLRKEYGYCLTDLNDTFKSAIANGLGKYFDYIMSDELKRKPFSFTVANGKQLYFNSGMLNVAIGQFALEMSKIDPTFIDAIRKRIIEDSKSEGIDPENFCFDTRVVGELKRAEIARRNSNNPSPTPDYGGHGAKS